MAGIYIHIPFCKQACNYCDFYFSTNIKNKDPLISSLIKEIDIRQDYLSEKKLQSIYFGGGTPSLLSRKNLEDIFNRLSNYFFWDKNIEITFEVNPDDLTSQSIADWKSFGINRLSIGLQSFNNDELRWMNRAHNAVQSLSSVKMAQDLGLSNISIDLIYGSKFQNLKNWEETLNTAVKLNTTHISSYNLTIENQTVLGLKNKKGTEPSVSDDLSRQQFLLMRDMLGKANFTQYEISNFGKEHFFAVHNSNYWLQKEYLGFGPSAHSFNGKSRQWNVKNNNSYMKAILNGTNFFEKEILQIKDRYNEYILTRLRTIWGCDENEIRTLFGEIIYLHFKDNIKTKAHLVTEMNGVFTLNESGNLHADGIASDLFFL